MIKSLSVKNYALIEEVSLNFGEGFTVLSGETGAGKSIIIDALSLVIGERAFVNKIRQGFTRASVVGEFSTDNDTTYEVRREVSTDKANRIYINDSLSTLSSIRNTIGAMVDLHGQHEHQQLLNKKTHLDYLDAYGNLTDERKEVKTLFNRYKNIEKRLKNLIEDEEERAKRRELLEFQIEEIENANLQTNEDLELEEERKYLRNSEKIAQLTQDISNTFSGTEGVSLLDLKRQVSRDIEELVKYDPNLTELADRLNEIQIDLEDIAGEIERYSSKIIFDPDRLDQIEERLTLINHLKRKYGNSIEEILSRLKGMKDELNYLSDEVEEKEELERKLETARDNLKNASIEISEKRKEIAGNFKSAIEGELEFLGMKGSIFMPYFEYIEGDDIEIDDMRVGVNRRGMDSLIFLISPNPGEEPKPLNLIASGGELSRIMLAMKTVLGDVDDVETMIFDEVDSGMGGTGALKVARRLAGLSRKRQIICVSHLPQIAAYADHHWSVEKVRDGFRNKTVIRKISEEQRVKELARMIAGEEEPGEEILVSARKLLNEASNIKDELKRIRG